MKILVVDDQAVARRAMLQCLRKVDELEVTEAASLADARKALSRQVFDVAFLDLRLDEKDPDNRDGVTLVREIRERTAAAPIMVTASGQIAEVRNALRAGAFTYLLKDELCEELVLNVLDELRSRVALEREILDLHGLVGTSPPMQQLRQLLKKVGASEAPVLVLGPTGSGKELAARAVHSFSKRRDQPLLALNCGAFAESLVEAQLFGYEKGAFTGADKAREGFLAEVKRGTLFLDEIAELPMALQTKLLRVLENNPFRAVGASRDSEFHGRIVAATHVDLEKRVKEGRFREDLYYRLDVLTVRVPPLDERKEDIPLLVEHLAQKVSPRKFYPPETLAALAALDWPGNVRQLRNLVNRLAALADGERITEQDILRHRAEREGSGEPKPAIPTPPEPKGAAEAELLRGISIYNQRHQNAARLAQNQAQALSDQGMSHDAISRMMGVSRATLFRIKGGEPE